MMKKIPIGYLRVSTQKQSVSEQLFNQIQSIMKNADFQDRSTRIKRGLEAKKIREAFEKQTQK